MGMLITCVSTQGLLQLRGRRDTQVSCPKAHCFRSFSGLGWFGSEAGKLGVTFENRQRMGHSCIFLHHLG
jgi:hypothetical protein